MDTNTNTNTNRTDFSLMTALAEHLGLAEVYAMAKAFVLSIESQGLHRTLSIPPSQEDPADPENFALPPPLTNVEHALNEWNDKPK